ncbi:MAG: tetratricopeptide repeat protein [Candidatus Margulisiibacteriota bacterium]
MRQFIIGLLLISMSACLWGQSKEVKTFDPAVLAKAVALREKGSPEEALPLFKEAAESNSFILRDYGQFEVGETHYFSGNYNLAIPEYQKLLADFPKSLLQEKATLRIGKSFFNLKNYSAAITMFQALIKSYPESEANAEARYLIARAYEEQADPKNAYLAYEETDLYNPIGYFGNKSRDSISRLKKQYKSKLPHFKASAESLFKKGSALFEQGNFEMAANVLSQLAKEYPKSKYITRAWLMLGRAEMQANNYPSAFSDLEKVAQGNSDLAGQASYYLGLAKGRRGLLDEAIATLKVVLEKYPASDFADDAAYWLAYYQELNDQNSDALISYYNLINKYPYSSSVQASIWRMGRIYYWAGDLKNAITYFHLASLYPADENTSRSYFFEAKAYERMGNQGMAKETYKKLAERFDHTYYGYRAMEKLRGFGLAMMTEPTPSGEDYSLALNELSDTKGSELSAIMEIWEKNNLGALKGKNSNEVRVHLSKYKELLSIGLASYAADEAKYLVQSTSDPEKESLQLKLGQALMRSGAYQTSIAFAEKKVKSAIYAGKQDALPKKVWQLAYPKAYWGNVSKKAELFGLDPYLVLAVMREESRFLPTARSKSGARGLMQIMPKTGLGIAHDLDIEYYKTHRLTEPELNIQMGSYYLSNLVKRFDNNVYLSLAGYNGGPNKIKRYINNWYGGNSSLFDLDEFVESIPARETRLYVQKVMGSYFEYKRLYARKR